MKKTKKNVVINVRPFDSSIRRYEGGFVWTFTSSIAGDCSRHKIINIRCDRWWLAYLAGDLREVIKEEKKELSRIIELTGFEE